MKIGICGGTFDPIHVGHLLVGEYAADMLGLDKVFFIPAKAPPHKIENRITDAGHRLQMVRLAIGNNDRFDVSDVEIHRTGPSYTVDTLEYFTNRFSGSELFFLMGQDAFNEIEAWRRFGELPKLARLVVVTRPGTDEPDHEKLPEPIRSFIHPVAVHLDAAGIDRSISMPECWRICFMKIPALNISASEIRTRSAAGRSIRYLVVDPVREYIRKNGLYRDGNGDTR